MCKIEHLVAHVILSIVSPLQYDFSYTQIQNIKEFKLSFSLKPSTFVIEGSSVSCSILEYKFSACHLDKTHQFSNCVVIITKTHNLHFHNRAKQRMKPQADSQRSERQFQVNDMVYVKIQQYIQSSLAQRSNQKLSFQFFGPYRVLARVGSVAYRLELLASSSIHPVFHVLQFKIRRVLAIQSRGFLQLMLSSGVCRKASYNATSFRRARILSLKD